MNLREVGEHVLDVIQEVRTLRMPRHLRALPSLKARDLLAQTHDPLLQCLDMLLRLAMAPGYQFQLCNLALNLFPVPDPP